MRGPDGCDELPSLDQCRRALQNQRDALGLGSFPREQRIQGDLAGLARNQYCITPSIGDISTAGAAPSLQSLLSHQSPLRETGTYDSVPSLGALGLEADEITDEDELTDQELPEEASGARSGNWRTRELIEELRLHPAHACAAETGEPGSSLWKPKVSPGSADQLVRQASLWHFDPNDLEERSVLVGSSLQFVGPTCNIVVPLLFSEVASAPSLIPGVAVISIVPAAPTVSLRMQESLSSGKTRLSGWKGLEGWILTCPTRSLGDVLDVLSSSGAIRDNLDSWYELSERGLGTGSYSSVELATATFGSCASVAVKNILPKIEAATVLRETRMLSEVQGHPNIIRFHGTFATQSRGGLSWQLVFECHKRGDLFEYVISHDGLKESACRPILRDLLSALAFLKGKEIFHRDVKPENVLLGDAKQAVLTDFGVAVHVSELRESSHRTGSMGYSSPEMVLGMATGCEGDAFGAGIVLYFMISRSTPFLAPTPELISKKTLKCHVNMDYRCFTACSPECRDLILKLICLDLTARLDPTQALHHSFFCGVYGRKTSCELPGMHRSHSGRFKSRTAVGESRSESMLSPLVTKREPDYQDTAED